MEIAVTGFAGDDGGRAILENSECRRKLLEKYSESFLCDRKDAFCSGPAEEIRKLQGAREALERLYEAEHGLGNAEDGAEGGVLAALWRLLKDRRLGGNYRLSEIPVRQQTIEICETFGLNPYRLQAASCRVWITKDAFRLERMAADAGVPFGLIGHTAEGPGIWRMDGEVPSSLRRPDKDEIDRVLHSTT